MYGKSTNLQNDIVIHRDSSYIISRQNEPGDVGILWQETVRPGPHFALPKCEVDAEGCSVAGGGQRYWRSPPRSRCAGSMVRPRVEGSGKSCGKSSGKRQLRFRENDRRSAGLEDYSGARRGDGGGRSEHQKRPVVIARFVPGIGKPELPARGAGGVRAHTGEYVFQAYARTRYLTTDEGIRIHIFDPESSARLDVYTEHLRGTNNWTRL